MSLDRMHDYLSWPADDLDLHRLAAQTQVIHILTIVSAKVRDETPRERDPETASSPDVEEDQASAYSGNLRLGGRRVENSMMLPKTVVVENFGGGRCGARRRRWA
jgi:hypothetical protein